MYEKVSPEYFIKGIETVALQQPSFFDNQQTKQ